MDCLIINPRDRSVSLYRNGQCLGTHLTDWTVVLDLLGPATPATEALADIAWQVLVVSGPDSRFVPADSLY